MSYNRATFFGQGYPPTSTSSFAKVPINLNSFSVPSTSMVLTFSAALTHLLFPSQEVKDLCFVCFQNLCVHAMLSCCVLRCAFFLLIFQRGLENDICLQRITRKPTHGQRPPLLLYQTHIWWRKDPKWKIPSILVSVGLTHLVNYFQVVLEL